MRTLMTFEWIAMLLIIVCVVALMGSAVTGYIVPESRADQTARLQQTLDVYRSLGLAGNAR